MLMAALLVGAVALGWVLAYGTMPRERTASVPAAKNDRRHRWVERHPGEVNTGDIERVLLRNGLDVADVRLVSAKAFEHGIRPFTMWMWAKTYGARELAVAVAGDMSHDELLEHLSEGTLPAFGELEVFAGLNGLAAATGERSGKSARPSSPETPASPAHGAGPAKVRRTLADLDIHEPGDWPGRGVRHDLPPTTEPRRLPPGWDSFFDDLAA